MVASVHCQESPVRVLETEVAGLLVKLINLPVIAISS